MDKKRLEELVKLNADSARDLARKTGRQFDEPPAPSAPAGVTLHAKGGLVGKPQVTTHANKGYRKG